MIASQTRAPAARIQLYAAPLIVTLFVPTDHGEALGPSCMELV
jgi:hypothetical protein